MNTLHDKGGSPRNLVHLGTMNEQIRMNHLITIATAIKNYAVRSHQSDNYAVFACSFFGLLSCLPDKTTPAVTFNTFNVYNSRTKSTSKKNNQITAVRNQGERLR